MESSGSYNMGFANLVYNAYTHHPLWYYNKAKAENLLKIRKSLLEDPLINMEDKKHIVTESNKDFISYIDQRVVNLHNNTDTNNIE